jgi:hypothetical protein
MTLPSDSAAATGDCLEARLAATARALAELRRPAEACLQVMLVGHVVWALRGSNGVWWIAPSAALAGLAWLILGIIVAKRLLPVLAQVGKEYPSRVIQDFLAVGAPRRWGAVIVALVVLAAAAAAPWWPALVLCSALGWLTLLWLDNAKEGLLFVGGSAIAGALVVGVLAATDQPVWISRLLGVVLAGSLLLLVAGVFGVWRFLVPLAIGVAAGTGQGVLATTTLLPLGLVLYPAALLMLVLLAYRGAAHALQEVVNRGGLRNTLGREPTGPREDEVRESDEFYRICYPEYRHWAPELAGEAGYFTLFGGDDQRVPSDAILIRTLSTKGMPLADTDDAKGRSLASMVLEGLDTLQVEGIGQAREALANGWTVSRARPQEEALAKMPWDHPYLLAIPQEWIGQFRYPPGSGIHDRDGYPCHARSVTVRIALAPRVVAAFTRLISDGEELIPASDVETCRLLLWNAPRIMPGLYETLLTALVAQFREESIALFLEHELAQAELRDVKETLLIRLRQALQSTMPQPLNHVVTCEVLDIELYPSVAGDVIELINTLRSAENNKPFDKVKILEKFLDAARARVFDKQYDVRDEAGVRETLAAAVSIARHNVSQEANAAANEVGRLLAEGLHANALPQVQHKVNERMGEFHGDIDRRFTDVQEALSALTAVTRQTASSASAGRQD